MSQRRERPRLVWRPKWEGPIERWAVSFIYTNKWRCDGIHDPEDLLQDAYLIFLKLCERYPRVIDPPHFMALFKSSLRNQIHDHSRYMRRKRVCHEDTPLDVSEFYAGRIGEVTNAGYVNLLLAEAPEELQLALAVLTDAPDGLKHSPRRAPRENLNRRIRRVLGWDRSRLNVRTQFEFTSSLQRLLQST